MAPPARRTHSVPAVPPADRGVSRTRGRLQVRRRAAGLVAAALLLTACGTGTTSGSSDTKNADATGTRQALTQYPPGKRTAAPMLSGKTITSGRLDLADLRGKVIVLNVWGSWCAPCRAEAPDLKKASEETYDLGVRFVGINTRDNDAAAKAFERNYGITYPSFRDPDGKLLLGFDGRIPLSAVPSSVIIDRDGRIAARIIGPTTYTTLSELVKGIAAEKNSGGAAK
ncbi:MULTISPECIES: TlpA disulfide reductase family protein [Streptomyces]|uniref:Redoxin domain-containing protein n=1 Tax=Streptomyces zinciresistens K42 TaxID=700597 RepID=G2G608_9ACTN|nr:MULTISPECIES: TlpA disulfide reductase family protein [Streptomyces]EGX61097.1 redoxin domain-containing protein [Streptomyces zinciresistens K42]MDT9696619.1 TlpA disulfide reductase family protein [Streptomyces sp. P17]